MNIITALESNKEQIGLVLSLDYRRLPFLIFDFTQNNIDLAKINIADTNEFSSFINAKLLAHNAKFGIGRYDENRTIYDHSNLFDGDIRRTIHLGVDLWVPAEEEVLCPIVGKVHSFKNNDSDGDYGPTIILEHELDGVTFYTLYGHLSLESLKNIEVGQEFQRGTRIGRVGNYPINGNWPPHLHFQIISDMHEKQGDFPGVASHEDREKYLELCPNPNIILQIWGLDNQ